MPDRSFQRRDITSPELCRRKNRYDCRCSELNNMMRRERTTRSLNNTTQYPCTVSTTPIRIATPTSRQARTTNRRLSPPRIPRSMMTLIRKGGTNQMTANANERTEAPTIRPRCIKRMPIIRLSITRLEVCGERVVGGDSGLICFMATNYRVYLPTVPTPTDPIWTN